MFVFLEKTDYIAKLKLTLAVASLEKNILLATKTFQYMTGHVKQVCSLFVSIFSVFYLISERTQVDIQLQSY